eukprot:jgi/Mesvir1/24083/Mv10805-RA.1
MGVERGVVRLGPKGVQALKKAGVEARVGAEAAPEHRGVIYAAMGDALRETVMGGYMTAVRVATGYSGGDRVSLTSKAIERMVFRGEAYVVEVHSDGTLRSAGIGAWRDSKKNVMLVGAPPPMSCHSISPEGQAVLAEGRSFRERFRRLVADIQGLNGGSFQPVIHSPTPTRPPRPVQVGGAHRRDAATKEIVLGWMDHLHKASRENDEGEFCRVVRALQGVLCPGDKPAKRQAIVEETFLISPGDMSHGRPWTGPEEGKEREAAALDTYLRLFLQHSDLVVLERGGRLPLAEFRRLFFVEYLQNGSRMTRRVPNADLAALLAPHGVAVTGNVRMGSGEEEKRTVWVTGVARRALGTTRNNNNDE